MPRPILERVAIALSLSNLLFFGVWAQLLPGSLHHYHWNHPPPATAYVAALLIVTTTAAWMLGMATMARRLPYGRTAVQALLFIAWLFAVNGLRRSTGLHLGSYVSGPGLVVGGVAAMLTLLFWRPVGIVMRVVTASLLIASPFVAVTFGKAVWALADRHAAFRAFEPPTTGQVDAARAQPTHRVLWIIFDELDQRIAFTERPAGLNLPQLDRLVDESLSATEAYPPAGETMLSLPSLLTGKFVARAEPSGVADLHIMYSGTEQMVPWEDQPTLFSQVDALGMKSAVSGWYHPYCRLFGTQLERCAFAGWTEVPALSFRNTLMHQLLEAVNVVPGSRQLRLEQSLERTLWPSYAKIRRASVIGRYQMMMTEGLAQATDPSIALTFLHLPVPHPGGIYDRFQGTLAWSGERSYLDNVALADRSLGDLRSAMERNGSWARTTVIVSSDHWYRTDVWNPRPDSEDGKASRGTIDRHIPFIVKLAGRTTPVRFTSKVNTVLTTPMILAMLKGEIADVDTLTTWLQHAAGQQLP